MTFVRSILYERILSNMSLKTVLLIIYYPKNFGMYVYINMTLFNKIVNYQKQNEINGRSFRETIVYSNGVLVLVSLKTFSVCYNHHRKNER